MNGKRGNIVGFSRKAHLPRPSSTLMENKGGQTFILHRLLRLKMIKLIDIIWQSFQQSLLLDELVKAVLGDE